MHWHIRRRSKSTATPAAHVCMAVCLLVVANGCQREAPVASPQTDVTEHHAGDQRPAKSAATVYFTQQADGFVAFPFLSSQNLDEFIAEVNARDVRKLTLKPQAWSGTFRGFTFKDQLSALPKIIRGCPRIETLRLDGWTLRVSDLAAAVQSENLQELSVISCIVVGENSDEVNAKSASLQKLTLTNCIGGRESTTSDGEVTIDWTNSVDQQWGQLLALTPNIEELRVGGSFRQKNALTGKDWPLAALANLQTVHLGDYTPDPLVEKVLSEVPHLESLSLSSEQLTGEAWMPNKLSTIRKLQIYRCEGISDEKLNGVFQSAPQLESFSLSGWHEPFVYTFDLSQAEDLRELSITGPFGNTHVQLQGLSSLVNLESLKLRGLPPMALAGVELSQFSKLQSLEISSQGETQEVIAELPASLKSLHLEGFANRESGTTNSTASFAHLKALQSFTLSGGLLEAELLESLPNNVESLSLHHCSVSNHTIATLLSRLDRLEALSLTWVHGGRGYEGDPGAITGDGWDFACRDRLRTLDLSKCFYLKDELISQISEQLAGLESLKLSEHRNLTGRNWGLDRLSKLNTLDLRELPKLTDDSMNQLPVSLEWLRVENCDDLTGESWQLEPLGKLTELQFANCKSLQSLGNKLPQSLEILNAYYCPQLHCTDLDYSSFAQLQTFSMTDCYRFDVKRLFMELPRYADSLRMLTLTGCESLKNSDWDMSALNDTLQIVVYNEAEPAYVGGLDKKLGEQLQRQLPDCVIML